MIYRTLINQYGLFCFVWWMVITMAWSPCSLAGELPPVLEVVATIAPLADIIHQVGGDRITVHQLIPTGASPHVYEPIPSDLVVLSKADALFVIGLGLEHFLDRLLQDLGTRIPVFEIHEGIGLIHHNHDHQQHDDDDHYHHHERGNPHIWLSLRNVQIMVDQITGILSELDPAGSSFYHENSEYYRRQLHDLDQWFTEESRHFTSRDFIAAHDAWPYLARDYHLHQAGSIELFPGREPTPRELRQLIDSIRQTGIRVVFAEPQLSQKAATVLAEEAGVKLAILDPLGSFPGLPYLEIMQNNLEILREVLR